MKTPEANIIKLPNISASVPQLKAAIKELQEKGYDLPDYPDDPKSDEDKDVRALRQDQGQRREPGPARGQLRPARAAVGQARAQAPAPMGAWTADSKTNVAHMTADDASSEKSVVVDATGRCASSWSATTAPRPCCASPSRSSPVRSSTRPRCAAALREFLAAQIARAKAEDVLFSVHLKATMMKVSDPIIFGHVVRVLPRRLRAVRRAARRRPQPQRRPRRHPGRPRQAGQRRRDPKAFEKGIADGPALAMVDSDKGITNLHVPSDIIVDASMPAMIRTSGHMGPGRRRGRHAGGDPGLVVRRDLPGRHRRLPRQRRLRPRHDGLGAQRRADAQAARSTAPTTRPSRSPPPGPCAPSTPTATSLLEHVVSKGDIYRMCQTKDVPIRDWVKLAVTGPARPARRPFWLDESRAHDRNLIAKVNEYLPEHDTEGLDIRIPRPVEAIAFSSRADPQEDTISVTGNVLRDYLTDLFPILELGTSAKMLSVVPLINGAACSRPAPAARRPSTCSSWSRRTTCAGTASASSSRWRSASSTSRRAPTTPAQVLADTLDRATGTFLDENKSPARKVGSIDNRGSHFYLALYWAQELAKQTDDAELASDFAAGRGALLRRASRSTRS